jgi:hypothetical protein
MTSLDDIGPELPGELRPMAHLLEDQRPVPAAAFRGNLRAHLLGGRAGQPRPDRLGALIVRYATAGGLLLLAGGLSAAGLGPLGA